MVEDSDAADDKSDVVESLPNQVLRVALDAPRSLALVVI